MASLKKEFTGFSSKADKLWAELSDAIIKRINAGQSVSEAVDAAVSKLQISKELRNDITRRCTEIVGSYPVAVGTPLARRSWWLNHLWPGETMTLSQKITEASKMLDVKESLRLAMKDHRTVRETATALRNADLTKADIPQYIKKLDKSARRLMSGDPKAAAEFSRDLRKTGRSFERLQKAGAPTERLKKAVGNFIKKAEGESKVALDKAMERLVKAKAQYNAERIARTEMSRAYAQGVYGEAEKDSDVIGIRWTLSGRHPEPDECNFYAEVDAFGLGKGGYPLDSLPDYPAHPQCLCLLSNIYSGEIEVNQSAQIEYLRDATQKEREGILGVGGARDFELNPQGWAAQVKGFDGYAPLSERLEV